MSEKPQGRQYSLAGQSAFLFATRRVYPGFWRSLNEAWKLGEIGPWVTSRGVVDTWLRKAVEDTVAEWNEMPDGPNARLDPEFPWFASRPDIECPDFVPVFEKPYPMYDKPVDFQISDL